MSKAHSLALVSGGSFGTSSSDYLRCWPSTKELRTALALHCLARGNCERTCGWSKKGELACETVRPAAGWLDPEQSVLSAESSAGDKGFPSAAKGWRLSQNPGKC